MKHRASVELDIAFEPVRPRGGGHWSGEIMRSMTSLAMGCHSSELESHRALDVKPDRLTGRSSPIYARRKNLLGAMG
jgi:hypothetical protein